MSRGITTSLAVSSAARFLCVLLLSASKVASAMATPSPPSTCAVVGVGVLGTSLCQQLLSSPDFAHVAVTGITKTTARHDDIRKQVMSTTTASAENEQRLRLVTTDGVVQGERFRDVVFCAPPSGFDDYAAAVADAVENLWEGPQGGGVFCFTSSGGVYGPGDSGTVTEATPIPDPSTSPRIERLARAEEACRKEGGCCLRLAGLYNLNRGAHNFWLTSGKEVTGAPDGIINLLHYEDAAASCLATIRAGPAVCQGKVFLMSDGHPVTRRQICEFGLKANIYKDCAMPSFAGGDCFALGKIYDGSVSNKLLQWTPKYASFDEFMTSNA